MNDSDLGACHRLWTLVGEPVTGATMRTATLPFALLAALSLHLGAADTTPPAGSPPGGPGGFAGPGGGDNGFGDRRLQRLIEENPELKGVDPKTPEGQERIAAAMGKQMQKRMADTTAENHTKLREAFAMSADEWSAVEPLLAKVEALKMQQRLVSPMPMGMGPGRGGPGGGQGGNQGRPSGMPDFAKLMLSGITLDPAAKELQDANKALATLTGDAQAKDAEFGAVLSKVRTARTALATAVTKAEADLRGVLTPRQEAILVDKGILE
jgi:hypothetical protein